MFWMQSSLSGILQMPPVKSEETLEAPPQRTLPPSDISVERQVCMAITNLTNHVLATAASKTLNKIKTRAPHVFQSPSLFFRALYLLDHNHFRLPVRRYILDLFSLSFTPAQLDQVFEQGARLQAQSSTPVRNGVNGGQSDSRPGSPQRRRSSSTGAVGAVAGLTATASRKDQYAWPSGQSSMLRAGMWSDEEDEQVDEAALPPKQSLPPVVTIEGFLC